MSEDLVGTVVGKYHVRSKIGTGSMGDVYEATNGSQHVALKVLKVDDETIASRFLREAKTMSLFQHPNIVELVEVGKLDDGRLFFAAELVRGKTLRDLLNAGPVDTRLALAITKQILDALGHAHAMGVVHRDIKPENVMLADGGDEGWGDDDHLLVKILDFGVAKLIGDTPAVLGEGTLTITGYGALGTPYYMSPEAVLGRVLDARADIYSIGAMLFELLTGKPPYAHEDVAVLMRMHAAAPIPILKERAPDRHVTPEIELLINEALAKKPEMRFKTAHEMITAVDAASRSLDSLPAEPKKSTDVFGALPLKPPAPSPAQRASASERAEANVEPSASAPAAFSPTSIPSASQPVQSDHSRKSRPNLPGVAPYKTPVAGAAVVPSSSLQHGPTLQAGGPLQGPMQHSHVGGPVMGVVVPANSPASAPMFAPPMPQMPHQPARPAAPNQLYLFVNRHKKYVLAGAGAFILLMIVIIIVATRGGGDKKAVADKEKVVSPTKRADLVKSAQELIATGHPSKAAELIEREEIGDDAEVLVVLGHARIGANRRLDGLAAYERALKLDKKLATNEAIRANIGRVLESKDAVAAVIALELAVRLDPPAQDQVKQLAGSGKNADVRRRAFAIAEREKFADGIDRVESWSLDLAQATNCEDRLAAIVKLRRIADPRAIPALKRAKTHRCVEREVAEAIAHLESQQPAANP